MPNFKEEFICRSCGVVFPNTNHASRRLYCDDCRSRKAPAKRVDRPREIAKRGVFRGMSIEEVSKLARDYGVSYGQFVATAEELGHIPKGRVKI